MKVVLIVLSLALSLLPFAVIVHNFRERYEPRKSLLYRGDIDRHSFALMGDSVFGSYYVNNNSDTIWEKFESLTGIKCFPGALNGASRGDFIKAAKYMSRKLPNNSTIFIGINPMKFIALDNIEKLFENSNYEDQFTDLLLEDRFLIYKYFNYFDLEYVQYAIKYFKNNKADLDSREQYNRIWNIDGKFATNKYRVLYNVARRITSIGNKQELMEINDIFCKNKIKAIFVLTSLNKKLIYSYSDNKTAEEIYYKLEKINRDTKIYLDEINAPYIDLFEEVPNNCFADLLHTNACGDEIIARSLADYVSKVKIEERARSGK